MAEKQTNNSMAFTCEEFASAFKISRTKVFAEIKEGRLEARKCGKRTIISAQAAENWFQSLTVRKAS